MLFGTLGEQKKTLSKGTFLYILALATAVSRRYPNGVSHLEDLESRAWGTRLRSDTGIEGVGEKHRRRGRRGSEHTKQLGHACPSERQDSQVWHV